MINEIMIRYSIFLENESRRIKRKVQHKKKNSFLKKYKLIESENSSKANIHYNTYEGTSIALIDALINSHEIMPDDKIVDVGCGTGIFMIYLASKGFNNLLGIELDNHLYAICKKNIEGYNTNKMQRIEVVNTDAINYKYENDVDCFYLFNPFFDKETYDRWIRNVEENLLNNPRMMKIIVLFPTISSMRALDACGWLYQKGRVLEKEQVCYNCMHFLIYEGGDTIESFINIDNR